MFVVLGKPSYDWQEGDRLILTQSGRPPTHHLATVIRTTNNYLYLRRDDGIEGRLSKKSPYVEGRVASDTGKNAKPIAKSDIASLLLRERRKPVTDAFSLEAARRALLRKYKGRHVVVYYPIKGSAEWRFDVPDVYAFGNPLPDAAPSTGAHFLILSKSDSHIWSNLLQSPTLSPERLLSLACHAKASADWRGAKWDDAEWTPLYGKPKAVLETLRKQGVLLPGSVAPLPLHDPRAYCLYVQTLPSGGCRACWMPVNAVRRMEEKDVSQVYVLVMKSGWKKRLSQYGHPLRMQELDAPARKKLIEQGISWHSSCTDVMQEPWSAMEDIIL